MSARVSDHRSLRVWQRAMDLVMEVYEKSDAFPRHERYCLVDQLRRAAISVPSNIAEGNGRAHRADYARFLAIARGSLREVHTLVEVAYRRGYLSDQDNGSLCEKMDHVGRMLTRMIKRLSQQPTR
jgi:four helix bundle protein